jgi:hypothetical protein
MDRTPHSPSSRSRRQHEHPSYGNSKLVPVLVRTLYPAQQARPREPTITDRLRSVSVANVYMRP